MLLTSVALSVRGTQALVDRATDASNEQKGPGILRLPAQLPGLHRWATEVVCACAKCYVRLSELASQARETPGAPATERVRTIIEALRTLCVTLRAVDPELDQVRLLLCSHPPTWDALHRLDAVRPFLAT